MAFLGSWWLISKYLSVFEKDIVKQLFVLVANDLKYQHLHQILQRKNIAYEIVVVILDFSFPIGQELFYHVTI